MYHINTYTNYIIGFFSSTKGSIYVDKFSYELIQEHIQKITGTHQFVRVNNFVLLIIAQAFFIQSDYFHHHHDVNTISPPLQHINKIIIPLSTNTKSLLYCQNQLIDYLGHLSPVPPLTHLQKQAKDDVLAALFRTARARRSPSWHKFVLPISHPKKKRFPCPIPN